MNKTNHVPYTWEEIDDQVRRAILCQASVLEGTGPYEPQIWQSYLGLQTDELIEDIDPKTIPAGRHELFRMANKAYAYAYQLDGLEHATPELFHEIVCGVLNGYPQADMAGEPSPLCRLNDFPLRRMFETFLARWYLFEEELCHGLTSRELALLSNMTIPAVRTSLSKEGFKLTFLSELSDAARKEDDRGAVLEPDQARLWLSRRRGFIPNRNAPGTDPQEQIAQIFNHPDAPFDLILAKVLPLAQLTPVDLAKAIERPAAWVDGLLSGQAVEADVPALRAIARVLKRPEPAFVARAVEHLVSREMSITA